MVGGVFLEKVAILPLPGGTSHTLGDVMIVSKESVTRNSFGFGDMDPNPRRRAFVGCF